MPSILSGCLILLKIAMAVNDGLHSMLSSIYSIIENVLNSDHTMEPVQETDSAPIVHCSKSRILEAFNRRRANLPIFEQTEVYVSNMNPYQEITITNKDYERKRKRSSSLVKKSQSNGVEKPLNPHDAQGNEDNCSTCPGNSQSSTPSIVSSDTGNESEYQSCKTLNCSVELEENIENICLANELGNTNNTLESSTDEKTSIEDDQSPNSSFLSVLQSQIKFTTETLQGALPNVKNTLTENVYGLTNLEPMTSKESTSAEVCSSSSQEGSPCRKQFLEETTRLYEKFLHNYYYQNKDANLRTPIKRSLKTETYISNGREKEKCSFARTNFLHTCHPSTSHCPENASQQKQNSLPSIAISDYSSGQTDSDCPGCGYLRDNKPVSKRPATKRINTYLPPLSLQKDRWIEMDVFDQPKIEDSKTLCQNAEAFKRNTLIQREQNYLNRKPSDEESNEDISSEEGNSNSPDGTEVRQSPIESELSSCPFNLKEFNYSHELDIASLERVELLKKVLQDVDATEVLEEPNVDEHHPQKCMLNFLSEVENFQPKTCDVEESRIKSAPMQTDLLDVDHIPLKELDTEEKQITYLNDLTENYRELIETMSSKQKDSHEIENELLGNIEERHKIMLDTITNGYKNRLDSITRNAGMCLNELCSIDSDLKTKFGNSNFKEDDSSIENFLGTCLSPQKLASIGETLETGLPLFLPKIYTTESLKLAENEQMCDTVFKNKNHGLLETESNSEIIFNQDSARNETSTPIKDEKIDDHILVSINLSSRSQIESSLNGGKDPISSICETKLRTKILGDDRELALRDSRQEDASSYCVRDDISLEAEDWENLAAQMSKNYENVVTLLNSIDDGENFSVKSETECSEDEDCNAMSGVTDTEKIPQKVLNSDSTPKAIDDGENFSVKNEPESSEDEDCNAMSGIIDTEKILQNVLNSDSTPKAQTEPSETNIGDTNQTGKSYSDTVNTSDEILLRDLWNC